jgi:hypothetical protein
MNSLGEVNFIQGIYDLGNCKNSVGLKPNAELRKDAKAPSYNIGTELGISKPKKFMTAYLKPLTNNQISTRVP